MKIALYQPDIPQNTGTIIRLCACLDVSLSIIGPCGFSFTNKQLRRAAMDYAPLASIDSHISWESFCKHNTTRLILLTTKSDLPYTDFKYQSSDTILLGSEQSGVPKAVHNYANARLLVPMVAGARSLNVAVAAAIVIGEALRQCSTAEEPNRQ